jgi:hypothetical protein
MKLHNIDIEPNYEPLTTEEEILLLSHVQSKSLAGQTGRRKISKKRIFVISLVAVFVFGVTFVFAASALGWDSPLVKLLNPKNEKQAEIISSAGIVVDKSVTKNGVTVTVKEVIGDRNAVYITVDVTAPIIVGHDDIAYRFNDWMVEVKKSFISNILDGPGSYSSGWSSELLSREGDTLSYLVTFESPGKIQGNQMFMTMSNFGYYNEEDDDSDDYEYFTNLIDDSWKISFKLNYKDSSLDLQTNEKVNSTIGALSLSKVYLSPISLSFKLKGDKLLGEHKRKFEEKMGKEDAGTDFITFVPILIKLKDGSTYNPNSYDCNVTGSASYSINGEMDVNLVFDRILELDQVESLSIGDCVIDIEQD